MSNIQPLALKKAKGKQKAYTLSDGKGLSILIKPDSSKLWEFRYTSPTTLKRRKSSLGTYPDVTLALAREKAKSYRELIAQGIDPIDNNKEVKKQFKKDQQGIFEKVVDEWFLKQEKELAPSTYVRKVGQFDNDVKPFFVNRLISTIEHPEIVKLLEMKAIKAPESASRLFGYLNNLWQYAVMKGYCDFNIIANLQKKTILTPPKAKNYSKITDPEILKKLVKSIYLYQGNYSVKNSLKFVLHLPLRAENLITLKWEQIDFNNKLLIIPRHLMKAKNENMDDFIMPLTDQVIEILNEQRLFANGTFVFKTTGYADVPINATTPNRALERMGYNSEEDGTKIRLHGFRGTFRSLIDTYLTEHKVGYEARERALDHLPPNRVERAYTHKANYLQELETLMRWWSNYLEGLQNDNR
ncbi:integrase arm-type DNA-binding domain-containing protein [Sulfurimonas sp.]|uniref:tyrosine-type recombinase/integrase n=1 Tax=Sulfurimonas sp. TaxID=2022749 RepID=UPI0025D31689|nr:integrase arm-type DNA-binding domain-containing protein [Sulfurimonas sp.]MBT5934974.1 integrase arm-type DNA-binding domain-containing protein [Sulfurimonas sp.]